MGSDDHGAGPFVKGGSDSSSLKGGRGAVVRPRSPPSSKFYKQTFDLDRLDRLAPQQLASSPGVADPLARPEALHNVVRRLEKSKILPLTVAQRGIWIGSKISRAGTVFNVAEALEIHGSVEPVGFINAIQQVIEEAETTRVNVFEDAAGPHQIIHAHYRGETPFLDFSGDSAPDEAAREWMMADVTAPCDMERDPLWLGALVKLADDRFYCYQRAHHIVLDGFGGGLLMRRVAEIYNATIENRTPSPAPFAPLATLVKEEAAYRNSKAFERDRKYWLDRLKDFPEPVSLAQARAPTAHGLARETVNLSPQIAGRLRALAQETSCSLPQILVALMGAFIHRTTGASDIVLGMPVSARSKAMRRTPGMAANGVMLRLNIAAEDNFRALAAQVGREVRTALRHQHYRFEDMRRDLGLTGQHDHIARVAVNVEPFDYNLQFGGAPVTAHNLANSSVEDMVIFIYDRGTGADLRIDFDANPSLYSEKELRDHRRRFESFCETLLDAPGRALKDLSLISKEERETLFAFGCGPRLDYPDAPVFTLIEDRVARAPDAIAVRFEGKRLTYAELNRRANHFARRLLDEGVRRGQIVALALHRCELYPIAVLGIAKAGAAFLPLDPRDPPLRLAQLLDNAGARIVIVSGASGDADQLGWNARQVWRAEECLAGEDTQNITDAERGGGLHANELAYVIYTSGSTGAPKGVMLNHGGLTNTVCDAIERFPLGPEDNAVAVAAFTFDGSVLEMHSALAAGATMVLASEDTIRDPAALGGLLQHESATFMIATPTLWSMLVSSRSVLLNGMKAGVAGEILTSRLARTLHDLGAKVSNYYGPTEATVQCAAAPIGEADLASPQIGGPIANTDIYILDDRLDLTPLGVAGELCVAGPGVSEGYLNNPALTDQKFQPNPFNPCGGKVFRTGDIARWRENGALEFLGRRDHQLKVRGIRIEPGEIETALLACSGVRTAYVHCMEKPSGAKCLAAYVTGDAGAQLDERNLRAALMKTLPAHAAPSRIFILDELPLTRSGKIDNRALPKNADTEKSGYVAPRTQTEKKLTAIFERMLDLNKVGVEDNFFEIGADSLTAVQLLVEIETQFSTQLSLLSLFDAPTIANLAREMDNAVASDPFETLFPLRRQGAEPPLFCVHSIVGVAWSYAGLLRHLSPNCPVYGLQARGLNDAAATLPDSIDAMAEDYLSEIRAVRPHGPYRLMGWSLGGLVAHSIAAKLEAAGEKVEMLCLLDAFPFSPYLSSDWMNESELVDIALKFVNQPADALGERPKTLVSLVDYMFSAFDVFSMPIIEKTGIDGQSARVCFQRVIENCFRVTMRHRPPKVASDIHVFRADAGNQPSLEGVLEHQIGSWRAYTSGEVFERSVACGHFDILNTAPLQVIGPAVREQLASRRG